MDSWSYLLVAEGMSKLETLSNMFLWHTLFNRECALISLIDKYKYCYLYTHIYSWRFPELQNIFCFALEESNQLSENSLKILGKS